MAMLITRPTHAAIDHTRHISILAEGTWTHEQVNTPAWQQLKACICFGPLSCHFTAKQEWSISLN